MGVNPEDPVAMASIQRVASTFFNAIDQKEGSPYVFRADKQPMLKPSVNLEHSEPSADSDQEELDRFIADIEDAADQEWAAEEAAEKEEYGRIRYWNREDFSGRVRRSEMHRNDDSDGEVREDRHWKDARGMRRGAVRDGDSDVSGSDNELDSNDAADRGDMESDADHSDEARSHYSRSRGVQMKRKEVRRDYDAKGFKRNAEAQYKGKVTHENYESEDMLSDLDSAMWESDAEEKQTSRTLGPEASHSYRSSSDEEEDIYPVKRNKGGSSVRRFEAKAAKKLSRDDFESEDMFSESEVAVSESDNEENLRAFSQDYQLEQDEEHLSHEKVKTPKQADEDWESD